ncbi:hypothetical protein IFM46972_06011 [Aspergillus udagawae]|uniref:Uncharacterized protein n=1 Tax=Aspergillus udagawae TaxID=91492 RepID=A0A8H3NYQ1_9EURO|nr:hypothetical protein IFM46972_06011 [Aspergillus udagawae]
MFGTLHYLPENKTREFLERESGVVGKCVNQQTSTLGLRYLQGKKDLLQWPKSGMFAVQDPFPQLYARPHAEMQEEASAQLAEKGPQ